MIKMNELQPREYDGKECIAFNYTIKSKDGKSDVKAMFVRDSVYKSEVWQMRIVLDKTTDADHQVYCFSYQMPVTNVPLVLIAATGVKYFQLHLQEEIKTKQEISYLIDMATKGM